MRKKRINEIWFRKFYKCRNLIWHRTARYPSVAMAGAI